MELLELAAPMLLCFVRLTAALGLAAALMWGASAWWLIALVSGPLAFSMVQLAAPVDAPATWQQWVAQGTSELVVGVLLGASLSAPLLSMRFAGALGDALVMPSAKSERGPFIRFYVLLGMALATALGGLRVVVEVLMGSVVSWPLGTTLARLTTAPLWTCLRLLADSIAWSLLIAGPMLLAVLLAFLLVSLMSRLLSPHGEALHELLPMRTLLVIAMCLLSLSALGPALKAHMFDAANRARTLTSP